MSYLVPIERLRRICDPQTCSNTTEELGKTQAIIGQDRAANSLQFGLGIQAPGFNVYVAGLPGTGRTTMVRRFLESVAKDKPTPSDWCYVNNFRDFSRPRALRLPAGRAGQFQADMQVLVEGAQRELRRVFESEEYATRRREAASSFEKQGEEIIAHINAKAQEEGFAIQQSSMGIATIPLRKGHPVTEAEFMALNEAEREAIVRRQEALQAEIDKALRQAKGIEKRAKEKLEQMDQQVGLYALGHLLDDLKAKYQDVAEVLDYLGCVQDDILDNLGQFRAEPGEQRALPVPMADGQAHLLKRYAVNVVVDNSALKGAPVVMELNPTYSNLFGRIENEAQFGTLVTDFSLIRSGSLQRANGGYLVLPAEEVLRNPFSWDGLKRALRNRHIAIEDATERLGLLMTKTLQPEPIPLEVKVVLIGQSLLYHLLLSYDENFGELFKVKADFDSVIERTPSRIQDYAAFASAVCLEDGLQHLDHSALAKIVEHGSRLAEDQGKLSTRFGEIADVIREANYYAIQDGSRYVSGDHVKKAIEEKYYRSSLVQERLDEMTACGVLMIDVQGARTGQINGLAVMDLGNIAFGHPSRITASVGVGRDGVVDIERQAQLGGSTHTKGVLILAGYLQKYAQDKPLSLSARLVFEQSYSGVDGDSASSAELYAILSELSGLPIKQGVAVTGSVNQKGQVQAIGGVNEKIEGFFRVCQAHGLDGEQGVIIPESNVQHLMLKEEVVEAVREGKFHVWSVKTVDEGVEILTGTKAGQRKEDGTFEEGTVSDRVDRRLRELAQTLDRFGKDEEEKHSAPSS